MRLLLTLTACAGALALPGAALAAGDPLRSEQYGLDLIEADAAHRVTTGEGAVVAVIDSGVRSSHQDLQGRLLPGFDFVDGDDDPSVGADGDGHGTHVLGIAAANKDNGVGIAGVAPGAMYLPVRVLGDDGSGSADDVADGIEFAIRRGADVINLSLGDQLGAIGSSPAFEDAIDRALNAGKVVVAAAGNTGLPVCEQPSGEGRLLCVASVDEDGQRSFFSSFATGSDGQALGISAPGGSGFLGEDIISTFNESDSSYEQLLGTSQAAPHVAGVAALLVSRGLRGQAVVSRMLETATDAGVPGYDPEYGAGIVNAAAAVEGLDSGPGSAGGDQGGSSEGGDQGSAGEDQGGPGDDGARSSARVTVRRRQRIRRALRRGIRVSCRASSAGRCRVVVRRKGRRLGGGSAVLVPGDTSVAFARLNRRGRRLARRALRRDRRLVVRVRVTLPGATPQRRRRVVLRP